MELILKIIGIASLAIIIVNFGKPADILKALIYGNNPYHWQRMKPLDCAFCLSWWMGVVYFVYYYGLTGLLYAAISAVIVALLDSKI